MARVAPNRWDAQQLSGSRMDGATSPARRAVSGRGAALAAHVAALGARLCVQAEAGEASAGAMLRTVISELPSRVVCFEGPMLGQNVAGFSWLGVARKGVVATRKEKPEQTRYDKAL